MVRSPTLLWSDFVLLNEIFYLSVVRLCTSSELVMVRLVIRLRFGQLSDNGYAIWNSHGVLLFLIS
jgi:hypothetical protein